MTKQDSNHSDKDTLCQKQLFTWKEKGDEDTPSELTFTRPLHSGDIGVMGKWCRSRLRMKIPYISGLQTAITHFIPAQQSRSCSCSSFLPRCPHLPPRVRVCWILSTFHSWGLPQVKIVANNLNAAEEDLEAYQREKQQQLNEILVVIPLKLHQVRGPERMSPSVWAEPPHPGLSQGSLVGRRAVLCWEFSL